MKLSLLLAASTGLSAIASPVAPLEQQPLLEQPENDRYLIELSPGETRWIEEEEKWALRRVRISARTVVTELYSVGSSRRLLASISTAAP
jgi:leucyl aminopeptidase